MTWLAVLIGAGVPAAWYGVRRLGLLIEEWILGIYRDPRPVVDSIRSAYAAMLTGAVERTDHGKG